MGTKIKVWHVVLLSVILGVGMAFGGLLIARKIDRLTQIAEDAKGEVEFYKITVGDLEENVSEARLIIREKEKEVEVTAEQLARLKAEKIQYLNAIGSLNLQVSALKDSLTLRVPPDTVVRIVEVIDNRPMLELPVYYDYSDRWINLYSSIDTSGYGTIGAVLGEAPINIAMGSRLFKQDYVTSISSPNPYLMFDRVDVQIVAPKKTKPYVIIGGISFGLGIMGGMVLQNVLDK